MARSLRLEYEGAIYHVTVRSNGREDLFRDDKDRVYLLGRLKESGERHGVRVYLFCLMRNHFHAVVETPQGNLGRFMQSVLTGYTVYFNLRHRRHGHVTQGRYGARVVAGDEYLLKLSRYVHLNPVHVKGMDGKPVTERLEVLRAYEWSSYPGYSGLGRRYEVVSEGPMLELVGGRGEGRRHAYREFVEEGLRLPDEVFAGEMWRSPRSIGDEKFREWVDERHEEAMGRGRLVEDVSFRREPLAGVSVEDVEAAVAKEWGVTVAGLKDRRRGGFVKGVAALMLVKHARLTQREVSARLGLRTGSAVSYQVRRLARQMERDEAISRRIARISRTLAGPQGQ